MADPDVAADVCEVVITAPDAEWLADFTRRLVEDGWVAGAHEITAIRSIYRWEGQIHDHPEARVALHSRLDLVPRIIERADADHPYQVPCVIALPITAAGADYLQWILDGTRDAVTASPSTPPDPLPGN